MNSLRQISAFLSGAQRASTLTQEELAAQSGTARRTLTHVLSGTTDYRVSTLLAVAWELGYEVALVPRGHAQAVSDLATDQTRPEWDAAPMTLVQELLAARRKTR